MDNIWIISGSYMDHIWIIYGTSMIIYGDWITESFFIILFGIGAGVASLPSAQDYLNYATVPVPPSSGGATGNTISKASMDFSSG